MNKLYFKLDKEVIYFCEVMYQEHQEIRFKWKKDLQWGNELALDDTAISKDDVINGLTAVFIHFRLHKKIKEIITGIYFYSDDHEVDKLVELTIGSLLDRHYSAILFNEMEDIEGYVADLFHRNLGDQAINYFDALVSFTLKPLEKILIQAVAYAIDAYKQEEAHQNFIHAVRIYLSKCEMKLRELYILQGKEFAYFDSKGRRYSPMELRRIMKEAPLYMLGLNEDDMNLSPVVSLAPENIYLYGNDPSDVDTLSLINVFQERVRFFTADEFPFYSGNRNG